MSPPQPIVPYRTPALPLSSYHRYSTLCKAPFSDFASTSCCSCSDAYVWARLLTLTPAASLPLSGTLRNAYWLAQIRFRALELLERDHTLTEDFTGWRSCTKLEATMPSQTAVMDSPTNRERAQSKTRRFNGVAKTTRRWDCLRKVSGKSAIFS